MVAAMSAQKWVILICPQSGFAFRVQSKVNQRKKNLI